MRCIVFRRCVVVEPEAEGVPLARERKSSGGGEVGRLGPVDIRLEDPGGGGIEGGGGRFIIGGLDLSAGDIGAVGRPSTGNNGETALILGRPESSLERLPLPPNVSAEIRLAALDKAPGGGGALRKS